MKLLPALWAYVRKYYRVFFLVVVYAVLTIALLVVLLADFSVFGLRLFVDQSGSMSPAIKTGSMLVVKSASDYTEGEIVTFWEDNSRSKTITHRIFQESHGSYLTKGDANDSPDSSLVSKDQIIGRVLLSIPLLGYFVNFTQTLPGLIIFILLPAYFIVTAEIHKIRLEVRKIRTYRNHK